MKVILTRDARIKHCAGETVEVSPSEANYLVSTGSAVVVANVATDVVTEKKEKKVRKGK